MLDIFAFSAARFGEYQAEAYHAGLERTFDLIAHFPRIGAGMDEIAKGHRRFRFQSHFVFYTIEPEFVLIRAIFHASQDIRPNLFE